jgi:hypothetical protein
MKIKLQRFVTFLVFFIVFGSCKKNVIDEFYARPAGLEPPIYQILEQKGNFKNLLALINKAGYKKTLGSAGYWTMFAPNDDAFTKFFQSRGIGGIDNIDSTTALAIVQYLLVYNSETKETIDDYQSNNGLVPDQAFRRRTSYCTVFLHFLRYLP